MDVPGARLKPGEVAGSLVAVVADASATDAGLAAAAAVAP